jgi:two-component system chemotaxis sensor kinase CheA
LPKELDMNKYARMFVSESGECLRIMNDSLLQLENDPSNKELVDKLFRSAHTIKGMAGMMGYKAIQDTAHEIESVLGAIRDGHLIPTGKISEALFDGFDALDTMVASVEKGEQPQERLAVVQGLTAVLAVRSEEEPDDAKLVPVTEKAAVRRAEKGDKHGQKPAKKTVTVVVKLSRRCSLPSARATVIIREFAKSSEVIESSPTEAEIEKESVFDELSVVLQPGDRLQEALKRIVAMSDVEHLLVGPTDVSREKWQKMGRQEEGGASVTAEVARVQTVRVGMDKLDDLLDNVGELVIGRSRLLQKASSRDDSELLEISALIDKLTSDIQTRVLGIRMIPLDMVMSRFPRMVRDIAKNEGKDVELVVESGNIELDRTVADKIAEPMVHLLRNCVDHGIETVEERTKSGKRPKGLIRIVASKQQDHVLIEVSDDGKGIDFESVRQAAVAKGVMNSSQADSASGKELIDLLFRAGFSTKTVVTDVSGRGVGLDVVKRSVEELGGSIMVSSSKGAGTTFSLWLPFTLAIIDAMLIGIHDQTYAVPMGTIVETHKYEMSEVKLIRSREVVQLRGEVLPLIRMREFFGLEKVEKDSINTLVVQSRDRRAALEVDELIGHQQIVVKSLDQRLRRVKGISGGTILGSGKIALILDIESIIGG